MKKILLVSSIALLLVFSSCFSFSGKVIETVFDPSLPLEQSAKILFWLDIVEYNGLNVNKEWGGKDDNVSLVTLPPGKSSFVFNAYFARHRGNTSTYYTIKDCVFEYNFEAGKEYTVMWFLEKKPLQALKPQEYLYYLKIQSKIPKSKHYSTTAFNEKDLIESILIFDTEQLRRN